jgi:hypothetical protein
MKAQAALRIVLSLCAVLMLSTTAEAQGLVRYVSATGSNANPCTRTLPCRTLQAGVDAAPAGGEVQVLDSGEYGPTLTITKSITVSAIDVSATLSNPAGYAVSINDPNAVVVLRGLHLTGLGTGERGISITDASAVHVERCDVERFVNGIIGPEAPTSPQELFITDTISRDNGQVGLWVDGSGVVVVRLTVDNSRFENNGIHGVLVHNGQATIARTVASTNGHTGIVVGFSSDVVISHSSATQNGVAGFQALGNESSVTSVALEDAVARGNSLWGLHVGTESIVRISNSTFTNNGVGIENNGAVETRGNNTVSGNGTDLLGDPLTPLPPT